MKRLVKLFVMMFSLIWVSCECPYQDELDRAQQRKTTGDAFYTDVLLGTWQCYYPVMIGGRDGKQIKCMSGGKANSTMAKQHDTEWYTEPYNYASYGTTV